MLKKSLFRKPKNELEYQGESKQQRPSVPDNLYVSCPECKQTLLKAEVEENSFVCPKCGYHFKLQARRRIQLLADPDSFQELDAGLQPVNRLDFPGYDEKLLAAQQKSGELEGVICCAIWRRCRIYCRKAIWVTGLCRQFYARTDG